VKKILRIVAVLEALSFLVLLGATGAKYIADAPRGVKVMGPIHGTLFLGYVLLVLIVAQDEHWRMKRTLLTLGCAIIPFGGFIADRKLINQPPTTR